MVNIKFFNDYLNFKDSLRNWEGTAQNKLMKRGRLLNFNVSLCVMCFLKLGFFIFCGGGHKRILKLPKPKRKAKRRFSFGFESARIQRILCFCSMAASLQGLFNVCKGLFLYIMEFASPKFYFESLSFRPKRLYIH